jgi:Rod binding domain-containing protein
MLHGEFVRLMSQRGGIGLADFLVQNLNDPHFRK